LRRVNAPTADHTPRSTVEREGWRRAAVRSCEVFFVLLLLEGVLRKWLLNSIQQPLLFIRDPVLVVLYVQYLVWTGWRLRPWAVGFVAAVFAFVVVILGQSLALRVDAAVYVIGLRNYLGYAPLAFIMGEIYRRDDVGRLCRLFLASTVPVGILVVAQFYSPESSIVNKGLGDVGEYHFEVVSGVVRPYGPFTFSQSAYSILAVAVGLIAIERRREFALSTPRLLLFLGAIGGMGVVSGSRTYFLSVGLVFAAYLAAALTAPRAASMGRRTVFAVASVAGMALLMTVVFPEAWQTMSQRQADAVEAEGSTLDRAIHMATEMVSAVGEAPSFGFGVGAGTNAGVYAATGEVRFALAEYEWTRIVLECGPVFGLMVISARVALTLWCGAIALRANLAHGDAGPLIMFGYVAPLIFYSQISGQNTLLSFCWFSLGMLLALARTSLPTLRRARATQQAAGGFIARTSAEVA
jgi:hypothetical protein